MLQVVERAIGRSRYACTDGGGTRFDMGRGRASVVEVLAPQPQSKGDQRHNAQRQWEIGPAEAPIDRLRQRSKEPFERWAMVAGQVRLRRVALHDYARVLLACIRLLNGTAALFVPGFLARQVGVDPDANPAIRYVFRMFGIRTILIGFELLMQTGDRRAEAVRRAVLIHASDTLAAFLATLSGQFPKRGRTIVVISAFNTVLAIVANR